jgi:hypothetical protein
MEPSHLSQYAVIQNNVRILLNASFDCHAVHRRASLHLLPDVDEPEYNEAMEFSKLKSSRRYKFFDNFTEIDFKAAKTEKSHVRIGIATIAADMEAPVGTDGEGYCVRDLGGAFHRGQRRPFGTFGVGDTIGFGIETHAELVTMRVFVNGVDGNRF